MASSPENKRSLLKRYALVARGGVNPNGRQRTRLAFIDRLARDGENYRGKMCNVGGKLHGTVATKNVTIDSCTIVATWQTLPSLKELNIAKVMFARRLMDLSDDS